MTKKKVLAVSAVLGIAALALSAGTLAYFTDKTDAITNTFTVGKVDIDLTEPEADDWGLNQDGTAKTVMMPGGEYAKTPTITVKEDSQDAYVFATLKLSDTQDFINAVRESYTPDELSALANGSPENIIAELNKYIGGFDASVWTIKNFDINTGTFTIMHNGKMSAGESVKIFESIKMPANLKSKAFPEGSFSNVTIDVTAYAIQSEGIEEANAYDAALGENLFVTE
ncbi:MAG: SipW-dependent-type signal peptide-containing protein [Candidatus Saccharibacteria bacterium]|nr:SipW-dependent-type signal peptide-containing protein [Candidatus Saccharibacteria bacterium]